MTIKNYERAARVLTGLRRADVHLVPGAHVRCTGKGREERATPPPLVVVRVL